VVESDGVRHGPRLLAFRLQTPANPGSMLDSGLPRPSFFAVMFERERPDPQPDIEFDFFDESPTVEAERDSAPPPGRRRKMPTRPPGGPPPSFMRLGLLIAGAILLAVVLVFWVSNCRGNQKKAKYQDYMEAVAGPAKDSAQVGKDLNDLLTQPNVKLADLRDRLQGLSQQQQQIVTNTSKLDPPGPLRDEQANLLEAMQFRVSGLDGLITAFGQVQGTPSTAESGQHLAEQAQRLVTSDVVYLDLFQKGSETVMDKEGVTGVPVPGSDFVTNSDFGSSTFWKQTVDRLTQAPQAGGLHGTQLVSVYVQPGEQRLSTTEDNTVKASTSLAFQVNVRNSGDFQETQVLVKLTIQQDPLIKKEQTIPVINVGETRTAIFKDVGQPSFGSRVSVRVSVEPVSGEKNTSNNTAEYPVIFSVS
jgi:CARDB